MTHEEFVILQKITDYCHDRWQEANRAPASDWPPPDMQTGKKMAYNDVVQFVRQLLSVPKG
jgi:hypothetical protein